MAKDDLKAEIAQLKRLANSEDWSERETAGFGLRDLIESQFDPAFDLVRDWVEDKSERIRRAACLACMQRKRFTDDNRLRRILKRLDTLMKDDSLYVRKCCGPFVVGYLGYTYPHASLPWLAREAVSKDVNVRTNVAKAFTQALGGQQPAEAIRVLAMLAGDPSPRVRSAVGAALRNVQRRKPAFAREAQKLEELNFRDQ